MKKSNVTGINESQPLGWLIYRPDTKEFLHSHMIDPGRSVCAYVEEPANAYRFFSESLAFNFAKFIDKPTEIVPLFDLGDKLAVVFTNDPNVCNKSDWHFTP
jgi:hypothetical protein